METSLPRGTTFVVLQAGHSPPWPTARTPPSPRASTPPSWAARTASLTTPAKLSHASSACSVVRGAGGQTRNELGCPRFVKCGMRACWSVVFFHFFLEGTVRTHATFFLHFFVSQMRCWLVRFFFWCDLIYDSRCDTPVWHLLEHSHISFAFVYHKRKSKKND